MSMTSLPIVSLLRERMQYHQVRQKVLAENVSNADTPGYRPRDLVSFKAAVGDATSGGALGAERTDPMHLSAAGVTLAADAGQGRRFETRASGTAVSLEDEMMKVAENQSEYQLATTLYQKSLAMLRHAAGVKG